MTFTDGIAVGILITLAFDWAVHRLVRWSKRKWPTIEEKYPPSVAAEIRMRAARGRP